MRLPGSRTRWKGILKDLKDEIATDRITDVAGSVTYFGVLALFPFLLFAVALASVVITPSDAERLVRGLSQVAPGAVTDIVGGRIRQLGEQQNVALLGFGALGAVWAASGGVMALMRALNLAHGVEEGRPWWKVRLVAVGMTIVSGVIALFAALVAVAAAPLADWIGGPLGLALGWLRLPVAALFMMLLWALLYHVLPDVEQRFRLITPGSVGGVILWTLASWAFSKYVSSFGSYDRTHGALAGVIVLLLWMWITSLVLLVGAEVNALVEHRSSEGKRPGAKRRSDVGRSPAAARAPVRSVPADPAPGPALAAAERRRPVRGLVAIAAGLALGVLLARREA